MTKNTPISISGAQRFRATAALLTFTLFYQPAQAHDFWIQPTTFQPQPGVVVGLTLRAGENLEGDSLPRNETLQDRFVVVGPGGESRVPGVHGVQPAGVWTPEEPGGYMVGYTSHGSVARMSAATFDRYIEEEGLTSHLTKPAPTGRLITDAFSRSAKSLIQVAGGPLDGHDAVLGLPFELVLRTDPGQAAKQGERPGLVVQLLYQGQPASGVLVRALHGENPRMPVAATTDSNGQVTLPLHQPGLWLIKAVRIAAAERGAAVDFHSHWASLTFEIPSE